MAKSRYWNHGDTALIVNTPKYGRKVFTGKTHMPRRQSPLDGQRQLFNNSKYHYDMVKNVDPNIECIVVQDLEMTSGVNYADVALAINSWMEFTYPEMVNRARIRGCRSGRAASSRCTTLATTWTPISGAPEVGGDDRGPRFTDILEVRDREQGGRLPAADFRLVQHDLRLQRQGMLQSEKGWFVMVRTYPRRPFWEQVNESKPMWTRTAGSRPTVSCRRPSSTARTSSCIVRIRKATPYLPNVIISSNPFIRPDDYGIPITAMHHDDRHVRNVKLPWNEAKRHTNPLWEKGYQFYCVTPKTRHRVHSQWSVNDWIQMFESNFGDPYRMDKRTPGVGEHQMHINPQAGEGPGDQRRRLHLCGRQSGRPAVPWMEAERSVLQGEPADDPLQVQPGLPVQRDDDEARAVRGDAEVGEGP